MELEIKHDTEAQEFTIMLSEESAEMSYARPRPDVIDFQHTYVPPAFQGKGVASKLIEHGLKYAQTEGLKVMASCQAVSSYLDKNPEYQKLLL